MYMTRIILKRIPPPNIIHGIISAAFPGKRNDQANESLWRIDNLGNDIALIIVSAKIPDSNKIIHETGIGKAYDESNERNKTIDYKPFLARIENGQTWKFRLCANPVEYKKQKPDDRRGKIFALRMIPEQLEWLDRQGAKNGFNVMGCYVIGDEWKKFNMVRIRAITFDGLLKVTDAATFRTALTNGIGRGKAYGCGLLTIARVQR